MYGQMLHTKLKFTDQMADYFNQAFNMAAKDKDFFDSADFESVKGDDSEFLSIIEDIGDLSLENTQINEEKENDAISRDEFTEYHSKVLEMFKETQDELKEEFEIKEGSQHPLLARIGEALVQKHDQVTSDFMRRQFLMGLQGKKNPRKGHMVKSSTLTPDAIGQFILHRKTHDNKTIEQEASSLETLTGARKQTPELKNALNKVHIHQATTMGSPKEPNQLM